MNKKLVVNSIPCDFGENEEYHYNAQVWVFYSGKWWYGGYGKYCKTLEEVVEYTKSTNLLIEFV